MKPAIRCSNLIKTYDGKPPVEAVRGIDLEVEEGECFGVLGPNGAGKTTTIEILEGLLPATSGQVEVLGMPWLGDVNAIREQIGITLQETQLSEKLTAIETLSLFRSFYQRGIDPKEALAKVSLLEKTDARVGKLSGGQKQRLAVAIGLVGDPRLLFLDEPTTGLDPRSRRELWDIISDLGRQGRTVMLTTHYMEEAERLCDRVAIIDHGRIIALGTPRELIASIGAEHIIEFTLTGATGGDGPSQPWLDLPDVTSVEVDNGCYRLSVAQPHLAVPALLGRLESHKLQLSGLTTRHASLEDVFVKLTGRHLAESEEKER